MRIVSLTPSNTEILFALGLGDCVVGVTKYCNYPPEARKKPKIGDANIDIEKVIALKPDLVVAHSFLNDSAIRKLKSLGVKVISTDPKAFADVLSDIKLIGKVTGTSKQADRIVRGMKKTIDAVKKSSQNSKPVKTLVVVQTRPLWVAGPRTFVDEMIEFIGCENVARDAKPGFNTFSSETAFARDPEVIIVTRKEDKAFFEESPIWKKTIAVRNDHVVVIDPNLILQPSPRLAQGLEEMWNAERGTRSID